MSKFRVTGTLIEKGAPVQFSDKFTKAEVVIETQGKYPDYIKFEVVNDDIKILDNVKTLDEVEAEGYVQGRRYTDKKTNELRYMNSLRLKSVRSLSSSGQSSGDESDFFTSGF
jgi:single-strand DNA-binding protein